VEYPPELVIVAYLNQLNVAQLRSSDKAELVAGAVLRQSPAEVQQVFEFSGGFAHEWAGD
jgi:hypothetical protein